MEGQTRTSPRRNKLKDPVKMAEHHVAGNASWNPLKYYASRGQMEAIIRLLAPLSLGFLFLRLGWELTRSSGSSNMSSNNCFSPQRPERALWLFSGQFWRYISLPKLQSFREGSPRRNKLKVARCDELGDFVFWCVFHDILWTFYLFLSPFLLN